jgi:hypothetical protein
MIGKCGWRLGAWVLSAGLLLPTGAQAGWPFGLGKHSGRDCPPSWYSPFHYWTPALYRVYAACHGPTVNSYIQDNYPHVTPGYRLDKFPCPGVDPAALYQNYPYPHEEVSRR